MTREEAKIELWHVKEMKRSTEPIEQEIERIRTLATKMTVAYDTINTGTHKSKIEDAVVKLEEYWDKLSAMVQRDVDYKNRCLDKIEQIKTRTLREILVYYFFMNFTLEMTAEMIGKSYQWTYELYKSALDEYCKISDLLDRN
jgi:hypothetical protein